MSPGKPRRHHLLGLMQPASADRDITNQIHHLAKARIARIHLIEGGSQRLDRILFHDDEFRAHLGGRVVVAKIDLEWDRLDRRQGSDATLVFGGLLGIAGGLGALQLLSSVPIAAQLFPIPVSALAGTWLVGLVVVAAAIGFVSGLVPAVLAAQLSVVNGLRRVV